MTLFAIDGFDLLFVLSATIFNLLIAGIFIAQKQANPRLVRKFGVAWLLLAIPLTVVYIRYWALSKAAWIMIYFSFILFYMLVEWLLDYVFKYDFRTQKRTHIPYIILEYIALFGLLGISFAIDRIGGFIVTISFWVLLGCLIYLYRGRKKNA
ncbi:MAG: hypothetical protein ISR59_00005 [Anaerolineales bacterium]|uniref:Uncharacterized protein n=1 Tax=Candidatus Desulfolinea nitratireducens TaxID=2841698 RepID=A0A8J6NIB7_9CHLR|nr:hypothetical protein [Candidatus Desulfolinea nitratireducens]MBL6959462.1 hypothetical protein [Anaerolineales bacterium]